MEGWLSLHRRFLEWEWFDKSEMVQLFIYLLLSANHTDCKWRGIEVKRGQLITSLEKMSAATSLSQRVVRTCINRLKTTGEIATESTNQFTIVTICGYDKYQDTESISDKPIDTQPGIRATNERQTGDKRATTNNNDNNDNNDNNNLCNSAPARAREEREREIIFKIFFLKNFLDPYAEVQRFYSSYEAQGWLRANGQKITDKIAAAKMWEQSKEKGHRFPPQFIAAMAKADEMLSASQEGEDIMLKILKGVDRVEMDMQNIKIMCAESAYRAIEGSFVKDLIVGVTRRQLHYGVRRTN